MTRFYLKPISLVCLMAEYGNRETGASSGCTNANARVDTELI